MRSQWEVNGVPISTVSELNSPDYDAVILVSYPIALKAPPQAIEDVVTAALELDKDLEKTPSVLSTTRVSGGRLVISPTGSISQYDDVRSVGEAAKKGIERAIQAGSRRPILVVQHYNGFSESDLVLLLGALEALYVPIQIREFFPERSTRLQSLGVYGEGLTRSLESLLKNAAALEESRAAARDIGGADPERMAPPAVVDYVQQLFAGSSVSVRVIDNVETIKREYPLFAAVDRASQTVARHRGRIIFLEYTPTGAHDQTVILVGKGVTYDTGGVDIKISGAMRGMSRDKSGAAAVAGFLKACDLLRPNIKVIGVMSMVRNSVGEESYVSDELILSRNGKTVRVGNTDAEGRMIMADLLHEMKERAEREVNPHIYTIATLTGHASRTVGEGYTIVLDNHAARAKNHAAQFSSSGDSIADMVEVSTIRREDFRTHAGQAQGDDVLQATSQPSTASSRGHQGPAAFLLLVSDLNTANVPYSHLDIAASGGTFPAPSTGSPILALAQQYKLIQY